MSDRARTWPLALSVSCMALCLAGGRCGDGQDGDGGTDARGDASPGEPYRPIETIDLPPPRVASETSLEQALSSRRSVREYGGDDITIAEISQLLWAGQGVTADWGGRTAPSAGAIYPLELFFLTSEGLYRYLPEGHRAALLSREDRRGPLSQTGQADILGGAPVLFVIVGVVSRTAARYGERAERYVGLEAGHAAQGMLLQAVALGLGAVPVGAFDDTEVSRILGLAPGHAPLYLVPVGRPAEG